MKYYIVIIDKDGLLVPVKSSHCQKTDERFTTKDSSYEISSDTNASRNLLTKFSRVTFDTSSLL